MAQVIKKNGELQSNYENHRKKGIRGVVLCGLSFVCFIPLTVVFVQLFGTTEAMPFFAIFVVIITLAGTIGGGIYAGTMRKKAEIYRVGLAGEEAAARLVSRLPDSYCAFQNLKITFEGNESELDLVVVGPTGIFVIENKNMNGYIVGHAEAYQWVQNKVGQGGTPYSKQFHSPIKQVGTHVYRLANVLRQNRINTYVEAAVYFSNNETAVQITGESKTPVFAASADGGNGVLSYITNRPMIMNHDLVMRTVNFLNGIN